AVGIFHGVRPSVVGTVVCAPPPDAALNCARADEGKEEAQRETRGVAAVRPQTVITAGYAEGGKEVVRNAPEKGRTCEGRVLGKVETEEWDEDNEGGVEPVYLLV
nr:hypothetical protein [Tanacetum cinerariifolium]